MTGHLVSHLVRRGVVHATEHLASKQAYVQKLEHDAELYEKEGNPVQPAEFIPVVITAILALLVIWSIDYTVGQVMSSLAMIESPSATAIVEPSAKSPPYADEPDALKDDKAPLLPSEAEADVEVTIINHKPITSKITTTIGHLQRIGGFASRWRGLGMAMLYHFLHATVSHLMGNLFRNIVFSPVAEMLGYVFTSVTLCRVHMAWTQKMIAYPSSKWWFKRLPDRQASKALLLPSLVYALAEQATLALPYAVAQALHLQDPMGPRVIHDGASPHENCRAAMFVMLKFLAVPTTYFVVAFLVLLPASVTLTRIEAALLPAGEETIVPFDRAAMVGTSDLSVSSGRRALFVDAWRSFDGSSRLRLIKLYAKMLIAEFTVAIVAAHVVFAELYFIGPERLSTLIKSAVAQGKLVVIEAHENGEVQRLE